MAYDSDQSLRIWTIYQYPRDYPGKFVARESRANAGGLLHADAPLAVVDSLEEARSAVQSASPYALTCMQRNPSDDPVIVECWF